MDDQGFDRLTKAVAEGVTRRRLLRLVAGGLTAAAAGLFGRSRGGVFAQAQCSTDADCDDDNACTEDRCVQGLCVNTPISCDDGNPCTADSCDPVIGCIHTPLTGNPCSTGNACVTGETCQGDGTCGGGTPVATCKSGQVKGGPCDCDGTCCPVGNDCAGKLGERRCRAADSAA
jgi:Dictyostelium (slime mold) repeat